jgi:Rad3-related DNA helicase
MTDASLSEEEIQQLIQDIGKEYETEHKQREIQQQIIQQKELKKYENKDIVHALKVINSNIDRMEQMMLIGKSILSPEEIRRLTDLSNELKKIRLGTNFNKMAQLLLEVQSHINKAEDEVLRALDDKKFLIDRNSVVTNIDVIFQYAALIRAEEKAVLKKPLSLVESLYVSGKQATIFFLFSRKDVRQQFASLTYLLPNTL